MGLTSRINKYYKLQSGALLSCYDIGANEWGYDVDMRFHKNYIFHEWAKRNLKDLENIGCDSYEFPFEKVDELLTLTNVALNGVRSMQFSKVLKSFPFIPSMDEWYLEHSGIKKKGNNFFFTHEFANLLEELASKLPLVLKEKGNPDVVAVYEGS